MKDNFSGHSEIYAKYRPGYPLELIDFILQQVGHKERAWDCATGNGQTAKELSRCFVRVDATDISQSQLEHAWQAPAIFYSLQPAEATNFADNSFDLVTVSQALHWLQFDKFYKEVRRVVKPGGWIAVWMYSLPRVSPRIDTHIDEHHFITLKNFWDPERKWVDENYATIPFPFEEIQCPVFHIDYKWTLEELAGYLNSWSALQKFIASNDNNPVTGLVSKIKSHWTNDKMKIRFPLHLRMGKVVK